MSEKSSIHQFKISGIAGEAIDFKNFAGRKILVVNVASECGFTPQYGILQELYNANKDKLVVVGFPCNDFGGQEPGDHKEIKAFCEKNYGVTFPITEKVSIINKPPNAIYQWLCSKEQNQVLDARVEWNFNKFLLDEKGHLLAYYPSSIDPLDDRLLSQL